MRKIEKGKKAQVEASQLGSQERKPTIEKLSVLGSAKERLAIHN